MALNPLHFFIQSPKESYPFSPKLKYLNIFFLVLTLLAIFLGWIVFSVSDISLAGIFNSVFKKQALVTTLPGENNILYPSNPDPSGRTIYYSSADKFTQYSGAGITHFNSEPIKLTPTPSGESKSTKVPNYITGSFVRWQHKEESADKYIVLENKVEPDSEPLPLIRVGFSKPPPNNKTSFTSGLSVIALETAVPKLVGENPKLYSLGEISNFSDVELEKIINAGDVVTVLLRIDPETKNVQKDEVGMWVASWVIIRRFNPAESLKIDLGRNIDFK